MVNVEPRVYDRVISRLRDFFTSKGFIEVEVQSCLGVVKACEDPFTVKAFEFNGQTWPLPQSAQMNLEEILLDNPDIKGVFCISTSYRDEPNPVEGRHLKVFPMVEFEGRGDVQDLMRLESELLDHLGFTRDEYLDTYGQIPQYHGVRYEDACEYYDVDELNDQHEEDLCKNHPVVFLTEFPSRTSPFWNMKYAGNGIHKKVDVIIHGQETIGSAERSCSREEMLKAFNTIMGGKYAAKLYELFGEKRVLEEVQAYLAKEFTPRYGAGIGLTRLIRGMQLEGLL